MSLVTGSTILIYICLIFQPLARLGCNVTGMDASEEGIQVAEWHAQLDPEVVSHLTYRCGLVEDLLHTHSGYYDGVVASEVLEHVADKATFISVCTALVKVSVKNKVLHNL